MISVLARMAGFSLDHGTDPDSQEPIEFRVVAVQMSVAPGKHLVLVAPAHSSSGHDFCQTAQDNCKQNKRITAQRLARLLQIISAPDGELFLNATLSSVRSLISIRKVR